jgi:acyl carrier protein
VGGEAFPPALANELASLVGGTVMNMYGPTETTVWSATHWVQPGSSGTVPLGHPLANQRIYILDSRLQPLPEGVPGELAIAGEGVVRGYLHRPELTAERFLSDHVAGQGRLYRTGDLARRRADGALEFLGRIDHQVKVRGYRIELGEIEAEISRSPDVAANVVVAREDSPGDLRLVAYVVPRGQTAIDTIALRDHLRCTLPDFMVPAHMVLLAQLPQTPNGKVDRKALPSPEAQPVTAAVAAYEPPAGDLEESIARVWREVLKVEQVGTRDNFFDLGGHSLLAVQVHRRLREALSRELSITDIFRFPTVHSLASYLAGDREDLTREAADRAQGRRAAMQRRQALRSGSA